VRALLLFLGLASCSGGKVPLEPSTSYRVLFIGNSLTYINDLPGTVAQLAASVKETVEVASVARIECQCFIDGIEATLEIALVLARLRQSEQLRNPLLPLMTGFGRLQQLLSRVVGWVQANGFPTRFHCQCKFRSFNFLAASRQEF